MRPTREQRKQIQREKTKRFNTNHPEKHLYMGFLKFYFADILVYSCRYFSKLNRESIIESMSRFLKDEHSSFVIRPYLRNKK